MFQVTILGSSSAIPIHDRFPTAHLVSIHGRLSLVDCGEGVQMQLMKFHTRLGKLDHIFISHLHGDHYFGLIGLLTTLSLYGRKTPLYLFGPPGLEEIIKVHHRYSEGSFNFPLHFHAVEVNERTMVTENDSFSVEAFALHHRIPCTGFLFTEKAFPRNIKSDKISQYNIPFEKIKDIKHGADFMNEGGTMIPNGELTSPSRKPRKYAFLTDTLPLSEIPDFLKDVDLMYHEATFAHDNCKRALETFHSTARQAAEVAVKANASKLLIGHFSSRYKDADLEVLLQEARDVFPNTFLAREGLIFDV